MPSKYSALCEKHYTSNDYNDANRAKKILKPDAVPSIFQFPSHLSKISKPRSTPAKRKAPSPVKIEVPEKSQREKQPALLKLKYLKKSQSFKQI